MSLASDQDRVVVDFGFTPAGPIGEFIFLEANADGDQAGDKEKPGFIEELIQNKKVIALSFIGQSSQAAYVPMATGHCFMLYQG